MSTTTTIWRQLIAVLTNMIICYMFIKLKGPEFKERYECVIISNAKRLLKEFANMKAL